ncbi:MAG: hypothetical protein AAGC78_10245 [Cellvibrio sp.]|uniref:hypothetical protein n=1 Tax=Cellvibrio sp. TaxID=1965322 RepID=UPI0031A507DA
MASRVVEGFETRFQSTLIPSVAQLLRRLRIGTGEQVRFHVRRPDDLLVFDLLFENLQVEGGAEGKPVLRRSNPEKHGILIVEFPPQAFGEEAFVGEPSPLKTLPADVQGVKKESPTFNKITETKLVDNELQSVASSAAEGVDLVRIRMAGASRVAFVMDAAIEEIPFTLDAVLDAMRDWKMSLDSNAKADTPDTQFDFFLDRVVIKELRNAVVRQISNRAAVEFETALNYAVQRITRESAGGFTDAGRSQIGGVMWAGVLRKSEFLFSQNPELREGDLHFATLATLALESAGLLSDTAIQLNVNFDQHQLFEKLPYISFLTGLPHEPAEHVTALELPYRLILSPIEDARWRHRIFPHVAQGVTELWHTRLITERGDAETAAKVRAIWSPDYLLDDEQVAENVNRPFRMSLDTQDRKMLVNLMGNYRQRRGDVTRHNYIPRASTAKRLQLSALGGLLDSEGDWAIRPKGVDLEQWRHLATLGRDHYVRVVYSGFLLPFGHAASLVKVTERKFEGDTNSRRAVLRQRFFIVVRERVRRYDGSEHEFGGRNFPFTQVELLTRITPDLTSPKKAFGHEHPGITDRMAFWPKVPLNQANQKLFNFEVSAIDRDNRSVSFSLPMLFVSELVNRDHNSIMRDAYNASDKATCRETNMNGASIRFDKEEGDSTLATHLLSFNVGDNGKTKTTNPNFHPQMEFAELGVPVLQKLIGRNDLIVMQYPDVVKHAGKNEGQVFLVVGPNGPAELKFEGGQGGQQTDSLGGLAAPQMAIYGLSKLSGPIASKKGQSPENAIKNSVNNQIELFDYFSPDATLIGGITLVDLFKGVGAIALNHANAPKFISTETTSHIETRFDWITTISKSDEKNLLIPDELQGSKLTMSGRTFVPINNPQTAQKSANAALEKFKLNLYGCIILHFDKLAFTASPGQKPDVSVQLNHDDAVRFGGPLEFVNSLRDFIPSNGFSDPPSLSVTPSGISASYSLNLPTIEVGIFSLSNVTLGAAFNLPFDNRPASVRFNFAERQRPFSLTVSLLGGGGFFAATVGAKGVQEIEAALEFGAAVSLNLVVASGMVEIKAGVYFNWKDDAEGKRVVLAGYVRIHGELTIIAIFSASLTFNLQLAYENSSGESIVYGEAELIVEFEVVLVSFSIPVRCRKEFSGGAADPKFNDLMNKESWTEYCAAFAPEEV